MQLYVCQWWLCKERRCKFRPQEAKVKIHFLFKCRSHMLSELWCLGEGGGWTLHTNVILTNVSVRRGMIWGTSVHNIHKGGVFFFSSVYIWILGYWLFWSKARCTKGSPKIQIINGQHMCQFHPINIFIHCYYMVTSSMTTMHVHVRVCIWVSRFLQTSGSWSAHWASFSYALWFVPKSLCSCLCLFDMIIELHTMNQIHFFIWKGFHVW